MSETIDRVATPIAAELMELTAEQRRNFTFPDDCNGDTTERARSAARAVLLAIRDPSEAMCEAGAVYYHDNYQPGRAKEQTSTSLVWQEMIDALLDD